MKHSDPGHLQFKKLPGQGPSRNFYSLSLEQKELSLSFKKISEGTLRPERFHCIRFQVTGWEANKAKMSIKKYSRQRKQISRDPAALKVLTRAHVSKELYSARVRRKSPP